MKSLFLGSRQDAGTSLVSLNAEIKTILVTMQRTHMQYAVKSNGLSQRVNCWRELISPWPLDILEKKKKILARQNTWSQFSLVVFFSAADIVLGHLHAQDKSVGACSLRDSRGITAFGLKGMEILIFCSLAELQHEPLHEGTELRGTRCS